jgi:hypothetical protein
MLAGPLVVSVAAHRCVIGEFSLGCFFTACVSLAVLCDLWSKIDFRPLFGADVGPRFQGVEDDRGDKRVRVDEGK